MVKKLPKNKECKKLRKLLRKFNESQGEYVAFGHYNGKYITVKLMKVDASLDRIEHIATINHDDIIVKQYAIFTNVLIKIITLWQEELGKLALKKDYKTAWDDESSGDLNAGINDYTHKIDLTHPGPIVKY